MGSTPDKSTLMQAGNIIAALPERRRCNECLHHGESGSGFCTHWKAEIPRAYFTVGCDQWEDDVPF
jgi:hypothetical protein